MEEEKNNSLFSRIINSKKSVILYIITLAIFYFGSIIGGIIIANKILPFNEVIALCGSLIQQNMIVFVLYAIFAMMLFFTVLPIVGIFVSFLPCLVISVLIWTLYIIIIAITGKGNKENL